MSEKIKSGAEVLPPKPKTAREIAEAQANLTEADKRKRRCCFTGHRPQKLTRPVDDIKVDLENEILDTIKEGFTTFITGMAYGTEIWAGNIVVRLKDRFPELKLVAAIPFPGFADKWTDEWQKQYKKLLKAADFVKIISEDYNKGAYQARYEWMVNHSSRLIAVYDGKAGGTRNTIQYAWKNHVPVKYLKG